MIYTITLNPAVDVSLHVREGLLPGSINQSYGERTDPGGKGINVSKTLKVMGQDSVICIGICGEDGDRLLRMLDAIGAEKKALIVLPEVDAKVIASARNIPGVKTAQVNTLNVYDIVNADKLVIVKDAVSKIEEVYA